MDRAFVSSGIVRFVRVEVIKNQKSGQCLGRLWPEELNFSGLITIFDALTLENIH